VPSDRHYSEWVGGDGGGARESVSDGSLVVGLGGTYDKEMRSLRLAYVPADKVTSDRGAVDSPGEPERGEKQSTTSLPTRPMRRWKSADGKFSVVARLESFDGKQATLVNSAGKTLKAPAAKLSDADRGYLEGVAGEQ
jgi:hypothetical protein